MAWFYSNVHHIQDVRLTTVNAILSVVAPPLLSNTVTVTVSGSVPSVDQRGAVKVTVAPFPEMLPPSVDHL